MKTIIKTVVPKDIRYKMGEILNEIKYTGNVYLVERRGENVAAIISFPDFELLQEAKRRIMSKSPS